MFVELSDIDMSTKFDKVYRKGMALAVEHECVAITSQDGEKLEAEVLRDKNESSRSSSAAIFFYVNEDGPLASSFKKIMSMKFWAPEEAPIIGKTGKGDRIYASKTKIEGARCRHIGCIYSIFGY